MSTQPDVTQLKTESLSESPFPAVGDSDFRVYIEPRVHQGMVGHAKEDTSVEICGVVVGKWKQDDHGPFAHVSEFIRCDDATNKFAEVTFTHESWTHINSEMDTKYPNLSIVGWYHSHPDFGIFLSDRDMFIQQNFFSGPGQFAFVVDPVRDAEGLFEWRNGLAKLTPHYWIGPQIRTSQAAESESNSIKQSVGGGHPNASSTAATSATAPLAFASGINPMTALLGALCMLLMGYQLASWSNNWQREKIIEGAVAHFGVYKLMHMGLEEPLTSARDVAGKVEVQSNSLLVEHLATLKGDDLETARKKYEKLGQETKAVSQLLKLIEDRYALDPKEQATLARVAAMKLRELRDPPPQRDREDQKQNKPTEPKAAGSPPQKQATNQTASPNRAAGPHPVDSK